MICIFCKQNSDVSKSIEHIIPESLGNKEHVLPVGVVCDRCNNYFSNKIEKPLMELSYFVSVRHRNSIENKKGRIPVDHGLLVSTDSFKVSLHKGKEGNSISFDNEKAYESLKATGKGKFIALVNEAPPNDNLFVSKFLGKVAIEALTKIAIDVDGALEDITKNRTLDLLRNYVRFGKSVKLWPYSLRRVYSEAQLFTDNSGESPYELLNEYQLFQTDTNIWHLCLVMFGIEYCINLCEPTISTYETWLLENGMRCPLY